MENRKQAGLFPGLNARPLTKRLVTRLFLDLRMTPTMVDDFGVYSADHYRALKAAVWHGADDSEPTGELDEEVGEPLSRLHHRIVALDAACGNGPRLNAFVRQYAPEYADRVCFETVWDGLLMESDPT